MPYDTVDDLPDPVRRNLPEHAQHIFLNAYNNAWEEYGDPQKRRGGSSREEVARRVAWAAVKKEYAKNEQTGRWDKK